MMQGLHCVVILPPRNPPPLPLPLGIGRLAAAWRAAIEIHLSAPRQLHRLLSLSLQIFGFGGGSLCSVSTVSRRTLAVDFVRTESAASPVATFGRLRRSRDTPRTDVIRPVVRLSVFRPCFGNRFSGVYRNPSNEQCYR